MDTTVIRFRTRKEKQQSAEAFLQACKDKGVTVSQIGNAILPALVDAVENMHKNIITINESIDIT